VRLAYFLTPVTAYLPRYASSWVVRVAAARSASPAALATAPEAVLGTATTATAYGVTARLTDLSPALAGCAFFNNPAIAALDIRLYLVAECMEFDGGAVSAARSRIVVFRTLPQGPAPGWTWEYVGVLAGRAVAQELGAERLVSPEISRASEGSLLFLAAPQSGAALLGQGCVALELASLDPPTIRRGPTGSPVVRASQTATADAGWHTGACSHDAASTSGIVSVAATTAGGLRAELLSTGLRP
jgi:hypothetical protein